ncbi:glutathione S-transferase [Sediminicurvatus halobius]|uniref:Glutathione S-transferase n=1 Tax=Sediminicurvatus halobius TaxID=2182432 RepID=A0A2U2MW47_9GAMM|nr:glutathione S-transferase [Spiribacter halobius]PWG61080.1 glutathione S-transferase [Spiribacter halobius]UEX77106.1 glutathione S-transferase [Spiribacter halobius]
MSTPVLVIGNFNYSSWSLRGWLALRRAGVTPDLIRLPLDTPEFHEAIRRHSPTGRVPVLHHDDVTVWDSLAIAEYANEIFAEGSLWPAERVARAEARAAVAEMHSGFAALRAALPMNCRARGRRVETTPPVAADIERLQALWGDALARHGGPGLFGPPGIAEAFFAPVALRFRTYGIAVQGAAGEWLARLLADEDVQWWCAQAEAEREVVAAEEVGA